MSSISHLVWFHGETEFKPPSFYLPTMNDVACMMKNLVCLGKRVYIQRIWMLVFHLISFLGLNGTCDEDLFFEFYAQVNPLLTSRESTFFAG